MSLKKPVPGGKNTFSNYAANITKVIKKLMILLMILFTARKNPALPPSTSWRHSNSMYSTYLTLDDHSSSKLNLSDDKRKLYDSIKHLKLMEPEGVDEEDKILYDVAKDGNDKERLSSI